jgi:pimeloyl-ACP methyl ester carboxylesterase
LRRFLLKSGDVYYVNYGREDFSLDAVCAQLDALVAQLAARGESPVIFGVSFGGGLILEWLRRARVAARHPVLAGVVLGESGQLRGGPDCPGRPSRRR